MPNSIHAAKNWGLEPDALVRLLLETAQSPLVLWDPNGRPLVFNSVAASTFGYATLEFSRLTRDQLIHPSERKQVAARVAARLDGDLTPSHYRRRMVTQDGRELTVEVSSTAVRLSTRGVGILVEYRDLTEQLETEAALRVQEAVYQSIFENSDAAMFTTGPDNHFVTINPAGERLLRASAEQLRSLTPADVVHPDYRDQVLNRRERRDAGENLDWDVEFPVRRGDGSFVWVVTHMHPLFDPDGTFTGSTGFARDATEERTERLRLTHEALTDGLTGLSNRRRFDEFIEAQVSTADRYRTPLSLLILDLDYFKRVNDEYGHPAGDALLQAVAEVLRAIARDVDLVARIGGEEFALVLPHTDATGAARAAERTQTAVRAATVDWASATLQATASIGVATYERTRHEDAHALILDADAAVYAAKEAGRDRIEVAPTDEVDQPAA
jgi:diguanylate cyclase (GGDEF)-like protein/PAS domain S-box-containing protein